MDIQVRCFRDVVVLYMEPVSHCFRLFISVILFWRDYEWEPPLTDSDGLR